ncbi:MAG: bifunctional 5,10-methylenetetrahydrofolate dehydrogenase/5,10-methenyltetrahydrofolate cyclohydrolase [Defluviitaleaceae bacterium]|nr:bifunctional 5,10-methylenetetrahydrofolate dehydrogenase/5,10-methenyltetrahydrofolate cyclohydrolase [Defluviitaleaceae bacterium]
MTAQILDGKTLAATIKKEIKQQISAIMAEKSEEKSEEKSAEKSAVPCIAVVQVGNDPASSVYIAQKEKACLEVGMQFRKVALPADTTLQALLAQINSLNNDNTVDGFIVQFPLPSHFSQKDVSVILAAVSPKKDIDCLHPHNIGLIMDGTANFLPCTPGGIVRLLQHYDIPIAGKHCVIIGRSRIVGKPMGILMLNQHATVTYCHSKTTNITEICQQADILISAAGVPRLVTANMIKPGSVLVDVGINRIEPNNPANRKICGDIDFDECAKKAAYITKVPGGVGPMTVVMLMVNTLQARSIV